MDHLWSPWRYKYLTSGAPVGGCIFCVAQKSRDDEHFVVHRGQHSFILLNLYPYTSGHLMIAPYDHVGSLEQATPEAAREMMALARESETHLRQIYNPNGLNIGMNIGTAAGAGIADHIHLHVVPRWIGDSNFMTTVGETRVMPEELAVTFEKVARAFKGAAS